MKWFIPLMICCCIFLTGCGSDLIILSSGNTTNYNNYTNQYFNVTQNVTQNITYNNNFSLNISSINWVYGNFSILWSNGQFTNSSNLTGPQGVQGNKGNTGDSGPQGIPGVNGSNGVNGSSDGTGGWVNDTINTNTSLIVNIGSRLTFGVNNSIKWLDEIYQNGVNNFMYLGRNFNSNVASITLSQSGRLGIQQPSPIIGDDSFFNDSGQNYFNVFGTYSGNFPRTYVFTVFNFSASLNSSWIGYRFSDDGLPLQSTYVMNWSTNLSIIPIEYNLSVYFTNLSGLRNASSFTFTTYPRVPHGTLSVYNPIFEYVYFYNVSNNFYIDRKYESSTTNFGQQIFPDNYLMLNNNLSNEAQSKLFIGRPVMFRSFAILFSQAGVNVNATFWYCNGSNTYRQLDFTNFLVDGTLNFTVNGTVTYDLATFNWSNNCSVNNVSNVYWMFLNSSRNVTVSPFISAIYPIGVNRFELYDSGGDVKPSIYFDADANNFNMTKNKFSSSGIFNYGNYLSTGTITATTLTGTSLVNSGSCGCTAVAVGGALSTATTGAFSSTITQSSANTFNNWSLYGLVLAGSTVTTAGVPSQSAPMLTFRGKLWNGSVDTSQEWSFATTGNNVSKDTTLSLFNRNDKFKNTTVLNVTEDINGINVNVSIIANLTIYGLVGVNTNVPSSTFDVHGSGNVTGTFQAGNYTSGDGTLGYTGVCTILNLTNFTVKNGLIVGCT
jgi:hypothetical protein